MAHVLTASYLTLTGPGDVSAYMSKIELVLKGDEKEVTTFGSSGWKEVLGGIKSYTLNCTFKNSYTDDLLDEDLYAIFNTVVTFGMRYSSGAISTANPEYQGSVLINDLGPIMGGVGDVAEMSVSWPGSGALVRDVTP